MSELIEIEITKEQGEFVHNAIKPFLKKYHHSASIEANILTGFNNPNDLKWLAISCYCQGLADAQQLNQQ